MTGMKVITTVSVFAALSIILAVLTGFVSAIVEVNCGTNRSHLVLNTGKVGDASANEAINDGEPKSMTAESGLTAT